MEKILKVHNVNDYAHYIGAPDVARFYAQQLATPSVGTADLLTRFENLLTRYYDERLYLKHGLPTVKYCAQELFLSPNYFGDLIRQLTDDTATHAIRRFVLQRARQLLVSGLSVTETAERLGFDYPQHFTRLFKSVYGMTPKDFQRKR